MRGPTQIDFPMLSMTCVRCAETLQEHLKAVPGVQGALALVKGGYTPDVIVVERGRPVQLYFRREETLACSEMVIFGDFHTNAKLPTGETVFIELMADRPAEYAFGCQMEMYRGRLIVE
jgi:plastocyanin domain-containing protein